MTWTTASVAGYSVFAADLLAYAELAAAKAAAARTVFNNAIAAGVPYDVAAAADADAAYAEAYAAAADVAAAAASEVARHIAYAVAPADDSVYGFASACVTAYTGLGLTPDADDPTLTPCPITTPHI